MTWYLIAYHFLRLVQSHMHVTGFSVSHMKKSLLVLKIVFKKFSSLKIKFSGFSPKSPQKEAFNKIDFQLNVSTYWFLFFAQETPPG